jgi:hypothetical protein
MYRVLDTLQEGRHMSSEETVAHLRDLLSLHRSNLAYHHIQFTLAGGLSGASTALINGIRENCQHVRSCKKQLYELGAVVDVDGNDDLDEQLTVISADLLRQDRSTPLGSRAFVRALDISASILHVIAEEIPESQGIIGQLLGRFSAAAHELRLLRSCKIIHDLLHKLQISCYELLLYEIDTFPDDEHSYENVETYAAKLEQVVKGLQAESARGLIPSYELDFIENLVQASIYIRRSLDEHRDTFLRRAENLIWRVLNRDPAIIDSKMSSSLTRIGFHDMITILERIRNICAESQTNIDIQPAIDAIIGNLDRESRKLTSLIEQHGSWQRIERRLGRIDDDNTIDFEEPSAWWPQLRELTFALYEMSAEQWALNIKRSVERLERAVGDENRATIRERFKRYRYHIVYGFYLVDERLLDLCKDLNDREGPLAFIMEIHP